MKLPNIAVSKKIFQIYKDKHNESFTNKEFCDFDIDKMYNVSMEIWGTKDADNELYIYTPSEIEFYVEKWLELKVKYGKVTEQQHKEIVSSMKPLSLIELN